MKGQNIRKVFVKKRMLGYSLSKNMKRKNHLYETMLDIREIQRIYQQIQRNTCNKQKVYQWESIPFVLFYQVYSALESRNYHPGKYHTFVIYEPKKRIIQSQNMFDKLVNHLVSEKILIPAIDGCLIDTNVASRKGKGTSYARRKYQKKLFEYRQGKIDLTSVLSSKISLEMRKDGYHEKK